VTDAVRAAGARPLRAAVVGAGLMGRWHADAVARAGHAVAAVVDRDGARAAALAARHRGAAAAGDLAAAGPVDVVHVCAPLAAHEALVRAALARGAHVVAEKPLAADATTTAALLALAASAGRLLVPVHQFLFQRGVAEAARALDEIGPLLHFDAVACTAGASHLPPAEHGRIVTEVLPHALSLVVRLVSPDVADADWHVRRPAPGELRADAVLAGAAVSIVVSTGGRPTANALRLVCARGTTHVDLFHGFATVLRGRAARATRASKSRSRSSPGARRSRPRRPTSPGAPRRASRPTRGCASWCAARTRRRRRARAPHLTRGDARRRARRRPHRAAPGRVAPRGRRAWTRRARAAGRGGGGA
jgi:predicted dehydrogenase